MSLKVSVVICCYNSEVRLVPTLESIAVQKTNFGFEVILVDNASTDNTADFAMRTWRALASEHQQLRVVYEPKPGLNFARETGIISALSEVVILCDDDNHLAPDFLQTAFDIMTAKPDVAIAGGVIIAAYETQPVEAFYPYAHTLALGSQAEHEGDITESPGIIFGAGMVLRRSAFMHIKEKGFQPILSDRKKTSLSSGGDTELCMALRLAGHKIFYSEKLKLDHAIPSFRLTLDYARKLHYAMGRSSLYFIAYYDHLLTDNPKMPRGWKKLWWWQAISTAKSLAAGSIPLVSAWLRGDKWSNSIMQWQFLKGRFLEAITIRGGLSQRCAIVDSYVRQLRAVN
jgi:glycosyltransferase involved in cell wall biosynthesis